VNEAQTKHDEIDPALKRAGWGVVEGSRIRLEFPITQGRLLGQAGQRSRPLFADYVLQYKNRNLAVIEAKASSQPVSAGVAQAKDYAQRLRIRFAYACNGATIYAMDRLQGQEGTVAAFPTPDELWAILFQKQTEQEKWKQRFFAVPFENRSGTWQPRYYQENAIVAVLSAVAEKQTRMLLTLATGSGKTAIAFQIAWKLFYSRWNLQRDGLRRPRVLFLADRNLLADQAFNAFSAFSDDVRVRIRPKEIQKKGHVPKNGSVFFTIFQTFSSGLEAACFTQYPADYFDFIIIDECHRGGANDEGTWRGILEYFKPAVQLGLTATPKRDVNADTYAYFGEPVYQYALKEGINDGFLTPFQVKRIESNMDTYQYDPADTVVGDIDPQHEYSEAELNRSIEIEARERFRVQTLLAMLPQQQKTLVFCASQQHAALIRDMINQVASSRNPNYCQRVTSDDGMLGEQHLSDFQDNEKSIPTVLTTSQKLSTGVDAPEVRHIVLLRPVKSMVEFKQIIGRGTRLYEGKDYFTIYDFVGAYQHFHDEAWDGPALPAEQPEAKSKCPYCARRVCICAQEPPLPCQYCGAVPCCCAHEPKSKILVTLAKQRVLSLDATVQTFFYDPAGTPMSATAFVQQLFGDIPSLFQNEEALRRIWSLPDTRQKLLDALAEKGYSLAQLESLKAVLHAQANDLYDVLSFVAYATPMRPRSERAQYAKVHFINYNAAQRAFLNFVLEHYVRGGVCELAEAKLSDLLLLKYQAIADAKQSLGEIQSIRETFVGFQASLYAKVA